MGMDYSYCWRITSKGEFEKGKMEGDKELKDLKEKKDE